MSNAPIVNATEIARKALYATLSPLVPAFEGSPACYWGRAKQGTAGALTSQPATLSGLLISQVQAPFLDDSTIDGGGAAGQITIKAMAGSLSAAETLLNKVPTALAHLAAPAGYHISARWASAPNIPEADGIYTAAATYRITISRA